jgi:hypothetical protein
MILLSCFIVLIVKNGNNTLKECLSIEEKKRKQLMILKQLKSRFATNGITMPPTLQFSHLPLECKLAVFEFLEGGGHDSKG